MPMPRSRVISEIPLEVAIKSLASRAMYSSWINPSIIAARVAGVPNPFAAIASRSSSSSTSLPALSIAESKVASVVTRGGGFVWLSMISAFRVRARSPGTRSTSESLCSSAGGFSAVDG